MRSSGQHTKRRSVIGRAMSLVGILFCAWLALGWGWLMYAVFESVAISKISAANTNAKCVLQAFQNSVTELEDAGTLPAYSEEVYIGRLDAPAEEDSLQHRIVAYFSDDGYFAVVTDGDWHVRYALWSNREITPDEIRPYASDAQRRFMMSPFQDHGELVGYWKGE